MQAPTIAAAHSLDRMVTTLAVSGSMAALARWNSARQQAKIISGRLRRSIRFVAVGSPGCGSALPPCARSGSTWPGPISQSATSVGRQSAADCDQWSETHLRVGEEEHEPVRLRRHDVLLEDQLQHVGQEAGDAAPVGEDGHLAPLPHALVEEAGESGVPAGDARGAQALLEMAEHLAFGEHREGDDDENEDQHQHALDERDHDGLGEGGSRHGLGSSSASGQSRRARCPGSRWPRRRRRSVLPRPSWAGIGG